MPLKVLLADDSAAIKKVVQLSLQDYGVELKAVGSGKDVLEAARQFQPDICFVDVMLPHKTGYEVVAELKKDSALKKSPVVMLWSAFMAFDEAKFKASGADEKLEKPFEVAGLRTLVVKLVPKAQPSPLAKHLDFPKVEFDQPIGSIPAAKAKPQVQPEAQIAAQIAPQPPTPPDLEPNLQIAPPPLSAEPTKEEWSMASFEDIGAFSTKVTEETPPVPSSLSEVSEVTKIPIDNKTPVPPTSEAGGPGGWTGDSEWVRKDIGKFKVPIPDENQEDENLVSFQYSENQVTDTSFLFKPDATAAPRGEAGDTHGPVAAAPATVQTPAPMPMPTITIPVEVHDSPIANPAPSQTGPLPEAVIAELKVEARDIIERIAWKLIPELASQIIRDELQRLLGEDQ